ncbi:MAG: divalent-cation tolerance protein CutA [Nitrososphaera sp.]
MKGVAKNNHGRNRKKGKKAVIVISTFSGETEAAEIGCRMVAQGLCACVNFVKARSIYVWKGKVEDQEECIALFKTVKGAAKMLKQELARAHPYEVPEIVEIKMSDISKPYLSWLASSTAASTAGAGDGIAKKRDHPAKR